MSYGRRINQGGYPVIGDRGEAGGILRPIPHFFTATAGQIDFPITPGFQPGVNCVYVWKNSEILWPGTEFTEELPSTVRLTTGALENDKILVIVFYLSASAGGPTGPAGGVLSGTFPNPGFAVDMATQAELNSLAADLMVLLAQKADTDGGNVVGPWNLDILGSASSITNLSGLPQSGASVGQVLAWNGTQYAPASTAGSTAAIQSALNSLATALQGKADSGDVANVFTPKKMSGALLTSGQQSVGGGLKTYVDFLATNVRSSDLSYLSVAKSGLATRCTINVPAGKRVWWKFSILQLIDESAGSNSAHIYGVEQVRVSTGLTDMHHLIVEQISPTTNYATVANGAVDGVADYSIVLIPWVFPTSSARLVNSSAVGFASSFSVEITAIGDIP